METRAFFLGVLALAAVAGCNNGSSSSGGRSIAPVASNTAPVASGTQPISSGSITVAPVVSSHPAKPVPPPPTAARFALAVVGNDVQSLSITSGVLSLNGASVPAPISALAGGSDTPRIAVHPGGSFAYVSFLRGIQGFSIDARTGKLASIVQVALPAVASNPNLRFVADLRVHPSGNFLYVVDSDGYNSVIHAFAIDAAGGLTPVVGSPFALDAFSIRFAPSGKLAFATQIVMSGAVSLNTFSVDTTTGALASVATTPANLYWTPGSFDVDPSGSWIYGTVNQGYAVQQFSVSPTGTVTATSTLSASPQPFYLSVHPSGKFFYTTLMGPSSASLLPGTIDAKTGNLTAGTPSPSFGGLASYPMAPEIDPVAGLAFIANWNESVTVYSIDATTGALTLSGNAFVLPGLAQLALVP